MHNHYRHPDLHRPDVVSRDGFPLPEEPSNVPTLVPTLVPRAPAPDSSSGSGDSGSGESSNSNEVKTNVSVLPVVLGAGVPIVIAICILIYLHRRHVRRLRREDANDKHKSLDFGLDIVEPPSKGGPMREAEKGARVNHNKGMSVDINHPYLLPPDLQASQDSFNSSARPAGREARQTNIQDDASSTYGPPRSLYMPSETTLNARRMSRASVMPQQQPRPADDHNSPRNPLGNDSGHNSGLNFDFAPTPTSTGPNPFGDDKRHSATSSSGGESAAADLRKSNLHLALAIDRDSTDLDPFRHPDELKDSDVVSLDHHDSVQEPAPELPAQTSTVPTPRISLPSSDAGSEYSDYRKTNASIPAVNIFGVDDDELPKKTDHDNTVPEPPPVPEDSPQAPNDRRLSTRRDTRRMTFGLRPLPPEDPADNPEQRANRIRSFYKEYFDENKTGRETYYEDYGPEYDPYADDMGHDPYYDDDYYPPVPAPFAEPVSRRAMTPPPRAPPRFQGHMAANSSGGFSGFSGSGFQSPGPRATSSASNRMPGPRAPRRPMPPPPPLSVLPTPHMLKDDSFMSAIDFAPSSTFKDRREGRPDSPFGGVRPFSPSTRAATPLASAFDELPVMPSAHALRSSGTFTNLDFAPPPRFKTSETASDAGSIRSNGTGLSNAQMWNIRAGAYRVSRLPTETVGTKDDMFNELRPKWDMQR